MDFMIVWNKHLKNIIYLLLKILKATNLENKDYTERIWMLFLLDYRMDLNKFIKSILVNIQLQLDRILQ